MGWELIFSGIIIAGFLVGLRLMQVPRTALWGNRLGALSMLLAILFTMNRLGLLAAPRVWLLLAGAAFFGITFARRVKMIQMPQTVALLNGFGGAASALVAGSAAAFTVETHPAWFTAGLALTVGSFTLSGSLIAALKLQGWMAEGSICTRGSHSLKPFIGLCLLLLVTLLTLTGSAHLFLLMPLIVLLSLFYGLMVALRVGGADMPVAISLLNALSGVAAAVSGLAVNNLLLVGAGAIVGVAGLILTRIMCRNINRNLPAVLAGFSSEGGRNRGEQPAGSGKEGASHGQRVDRGERSPRDLEPGREPEPKPDTAGDAVGEAARDPALEAAALLEAARRVVIVPGYGMAVAQAQQHVRELLDLLDERGKSVRIAIHPVAGRMPGHMNVLLAEAGIDYDRLHNLEAINPGFAEADLALVVGACDVINPAANTAEGTPIYGMPVLNVEETERVVICNLDEKPGYSGVDNPLYERDNVTLLWGDAAETIPRLLELLRGGVETQDT